MWHVLGIHNVVLSKLFNSPRLSCCSSNSFGLFSSSQIIHSCTCRCRFLPLSHQSFENVSFCMISVPVSYKSFREKENPQGSIGCNENWTHHFYFKDWSNNLLLEKLCSHSQALCFLVSSVNWQKADYSYTCQQAMATQNSCLQRVEIRWQTYVFVYPYMMSQYDACYHLFLYPCLTTSLMSFSKMFEIILIVLQFQRKQNQ